MCLRSAQSKASKGKKIWASSSLKWTRREWANERMRSVSLSVVALFYFILFCCVRDFSSYFMALIALQNTLAHKPTRIHARFVTLNEFYDANRFSVVAPISFFVNGWYFNFNHRFKQHFMVIIELRATKTREQITNINEKEWASQVCAGERVEIMGHTLSQCADGGSTFSLFFNFFMCTDPFHVSTATAHTQN